MIKEQKLFNNSLLKFILDNPNYNEYKKFMTKNFNLEAADEEFIELWKKINYKQIYDKGYYSFCDVLLHTVKSLEKFNIVFKLFPAEKIDSELVNNIQYAFQKSIPIMTGYIVLGMGFGILLQKQGYGLLWAFLMSLCIYAGSMQYVTIDLLGSGASLVATALMTLMVNIRHVFYGITMPT